MLLLLWLGGGTAPACWHPCVQRSRHSGDASRVPANIEGLLTGIEVFANATELRRWGCNRLGVALGDQRRYAYFVMWATHRDVNVAYHRHVVALGRYLIAQQGGNRR